MTAVNRAYEDLRDPATRLRIDEQLQAGRTTRTLVYVVGASVLVVLLTALSLRVARRPPPAGLPAAIAATRDRPGDAAAWDLRWRMEAASGLTADALTSLSRALSLDPTSVELHEAHGSMAARAGDAATALAEATWLRAHGLHGRANRLAAESVK